MAKDRTEQRRLIHRDQAFHFVSYGPADTGLGGPSWFLMSSGKRWQALPFQDGQDDAELDRNLARWLDDNVFAPPPQAPAADRVAT